MKKRIVCLLLTLIMVLGSVASLASCMGGTTTQTPTVCVHTDANHDGVCDKNCGQTGMTYTHKATDDANHDGKCDACQKATGIKVTHVDANHDGKCDAYLKGCKETNMEVVHVDTAPADGKCDVCNANVETEHDCIDQDGEDGEPDGKCDICGEEFVCDHVDEDGDGYCDNCFEEYEAVCEHVDNNGDDYCDNCDEYMGNAHTCVDVDGNKRCDLCNKDLSDSGNDDVINYPWPETTLIFQMTHNTNNQELPSACERYLAGEDAKASQDIDTKVRRRNTEAEFFTKTDVKYQYYDDDPKYNWGTNIERIQLTNQAGGATAPDMYCNFVYDMVGASIKSCFANLKSTTRGENYFRFMANDYDESVNNEGYMYEYMNSLTLSQSKMYVLASDYFTDMIRAFFCIPVSVRIMEGSGADIVAVGDEEGETYADGDRNGDKKFNIDDFYEQVKDGEWTYDLLAKFSEAVYIGASQGGTGGTSIKDDRLGFVMQTSGLAASGLMYTTSVEIIKREYQNDGSIRYYYPTDNQDFYEFCDATTKLFQKTGVLITNETGGYGTDAMKAIRNRFTQNKILFGDIILVGAFEFDEYQTMKESGGGFGIVPVPLFRTEHVLRDENGQALTDAQGNEIVEKDRYLTQIHNMGRAGGIATITKKFSQCTAFLNYQSTHSTEILNDYYKYRLQYDAAGGAQGTVYMLQYIRENVRSSFDKAIEDALGVFSAEAKKDKWHDILAAARFQVDIRPTYSSKYNSKKSYLDALVKEFEENLPA